MLVTDVHIAVVERALVSFALFSNRSFISRKIASDCSPTSRMVSLFRLLDCSVASTSFSNKCKSCEAVTSVFNDFGVIGQPLQQLFTLPAGARGFGLVLPGSTREIVLGMDGRNTGRFARCLFANQA